MNTPCVNVGLALLIGMLVTSALQLSGAQTPADPQHITRGAAVFQQLFGADNGLGPAYNAVSCASCHSTPAPGGSGESMVPWQYLDDADALGAPAQRFHLTRSGRVVTLPVGDSPARRPPALFGLGQLEAVRPDDLRRRSDPFDRDGDGISGRLPWREDCFGRFGWQSTVCDLRAFVDGALSGEMGVETRPESRREIAKTDVEHLVAYVRRLPPLPGSGSDDGADLFARVGCAACHVPVTGMATIDGQRITVRAYTDLLVHEMGPGPGHTETDSRGELRTAPLWGIGQSRPPYLHDGSATTLDGAILRHGGEAAAAQQSYRRLRPAERARLLEYLRTR